MKDLVWISALEYARWAPSPHNTQLWKVKIIAPDTIDVYFDRTRLLPVENASNSFMICGIGAFIESISIALVPLGEDVEVSYKDEAPNVSQKELEYFCTLTLVSRKNPEVLSRELISKRRTSRLPYKPNTVPENVCTELAEEAKRFGHTFTFSTDVTLIKKILILNKNTLFYDMDDAPTRKEVDAWMRYTKKSAEAKQDGLWTHCLRIPAVFAYMFFRLRFIFNISFIKKMIGAFYLRTTAGTKNIGWISGRMNNKEEWLSSGRMLMRLWLIMTRENIYLHPFGSVVTNPKSHKEALELLKRGDTSEETLWLIVRFGYSDVPPRSHRMPVEDFIIN